MASIRNGGGLHLYMGLQVLGYQRLFMALLFVMSTNIVGVHCQLVTNAPTPAPQVPTPTQQRPSFAIFHQYEADALNAVFNNWTALNPQLSTLLKWSPAQHPCDTSALDYDNTGEFEGPWRGVFCTLVLRESNATGYYHEVSVTKLMLYGSNSRCGWEYNSQCDFAGINGELPSDISKLINLKYLFIDHHPKLTGPVPPELWQMPNLLEVAMQDNSLVGVLTSNVFNPSSKLSGIYLYKNNFSGSLQVSSEGTLFSSTLKYLNVTFNQLDGPVDLQGLNVNASGALSLLALSNNRFSGTFSMGSYFNPQNLFLSNNRFTSIIFANYTGKLTQPAGLSTVYMPSLQSLYIDNNALSGPFPSEILHMPGLKYLSLSGNNFFGSVDFRAMKNSWITHIKSLDLSKNNFFGSVDFRGIDGTLELRDLDISNNNFNGTFFASSYLNVLNMDLSNNYFNDVIFDIYNGTTSQVENGFMPLLKSLNIQKNNLSGEFPSQLLKAPSLQILYGGQNQYKTLQLPDISFENLNLSAIFLTENSIDGIQFPNNSGRLSTSNLQVSNLLFLGGNPMCKKIGNVLLSTICRMNQSSPALEVLSKPNTKTTVIIATSTSSSFVLVMLITMLYVWRLMSRIKSLNHILREFEKKEVNPNLYSYKEIKLATKNFDKKYKIGEGGFGIVFKGELVDGTTIAVKKLTMLSNQMLPEFLNEVVVITGLKHRNLVKLKGCCLGDGDLRMLVFEYVENKNLAEALWGQENSEFQYLDWATRFDIIVGIARGLACLHEDLQSPIIHRDIKASNILLDKNYNPKIADFGLAYLFPTLDNEASHLTLMQVAGTRGYWSPEYALHGQISTALDVYSFGIVVLEIVSGRKCLDLQKPSEEICLREWAWRQFEAQASMTLIDSKMKHSLTDLDTIMCVISVALACVHYKATKRPKMHDVVSMLLQKMKITNYPMDFEYGEAIGDVTSNFSDTSSTTSLFWKEKIKVDEHSLLSYTRIIEMNEMA